MNSMYLLIPLSLVFAGVAVWAISYAVKSNQFDDLENAKEQIILDDRIARRGIEQIAPDSLPDKLGASNEHA